MSKWTKNLALGAALMGLLGTTACKRVVLRDTETYKNEVYFLQMALEQNTELLRAHLADGTCSCDEDGQWNNEVCETSALNVVVLETRLDWHVAMMMYLGGIEKENPGEEPELDASAVSELCPSDG